MSDPQPPSDQPQQPGPYGGPPPYGPPSPPPPYGRPGPAYGQQPSAGLPHYQPPPGAVAQPGPPPSPLVAVVGWIILGVSVVVVLAAFMPWATFMGLSKSGVDGGSDGTITLTLALITGVLGLLRGLMPARSGLALATGITALVVGGLVAITGIADTSDVSSHGLHVGFGLVLTLIAGVCLFAVGLWGIIKRR